MNYQNITAIVRSADGVDFAVSTDQRAIPYELAFARARHSDELAAHTDFVRVSAPLTEAERPWRSMDDLPDVPASTRALVRQHVAPVITLPRTCDGAHEALCRAQAVWKTAAVVQGDKP